MSLDGRRYFQELERLLALEMKAEATDVARRLAGGEKRTGESLLGLVVRSEVSALGGRLLVTLGKREATQPLPWHRLTVGTPVLVTAEGGQWRGLVSGGDRQRIVVAMSDLPEGEPIRLDVATDDVGQRRMVEALHTAQTRHDPALANLRAVLLGESAPSFAPVDAVSWLNPRLNETQREAVQMGLSAQEVALIHGPPGTGKTTAVVEFICQAVRRGERVLACAPSNMAVDNLLEQLLGWGEAAVRLGHPARVTPALRARTLDFLVEAHGDVQLARKMHREAHELFGKARRWTRAKPERGEKQGMRAEAKALLAEARTLEATAVERILDGAMVVCATLTGLNEEILKGRVFDVCVVDEAAQAIEPAVWIAILRAKRVVLAGDHCQLPPTVLSQKAARGGLGESMMARLMGVWGEVASQRLEVQYRMHEQIMRFSSAWFYGGSQVADAAVASRLLAGLTAVQTTPLTNTAVTFIDTAGAGYEEQVETDGESRLNVEEAALAVQMVRELLAAGVAQEAIALIAPYAAQVRHVRERLDELGWERIEVNSVDGFQGREKEVVVLTLVRSNYEGQIGFLADTRRMNVALTRAKRKLIVIGDSATITVERFYAELVGYFEEIGAYRSVWELASH